MDDVWRNTGMFEFILGVITSAGIFSGIALLGLTYPSDFVRLNQCARELGQTEVGMVTGYTKTYVEVRYGQVRKAVDVAKFLNNYTKEDCNGSTRN